MEPKSNHEPHAYGQVADSGTVRSSGKLLWRVFHGHFHFALCRAGLDAYIEDMSRLIRFLFAGGRLFLGLSMVPLIAFGVETTSSERLPNIIFITVDDLGWADLGCYGSKFHETPAIDRLAAEGMRFTDAYAAAAVCSPTRAAMLTGRYPARLGLTDWLRAEYQGGKIPADRKNPTGFDKNPDSKLDTPTNALWLELDEMTTAEVLKKRGYTTAHIGKWHLGFDDWSPEAQGFEVNIGGGDVGEPPSYFDPFLRPANTAWKEPALKGIPKMPSRLHGEYLSDREADEAVNFIRQHRGGPFLLDLWHYAVHLPLGAKPELIEKYKAKNPQGGQKNPDYAAMIESVDQALARIVAVLDELDIASRTIIVFTSDNGGLSWITDNAPLRAGKGEPYEGGIRVPFIVRWPGVVPPNSTCNTPVISVDLLPTFTEIAGAALPVDRKIDGVSMVPLLRGAPSLEREAIFWHYPHYRQGNATPYTIVRKGDWKLIMRYGGKPSELFDLSQDLSEKNDLAAEQPEKVKELETAITNWTKDVGARLPRAGN
ncbi:MAG: sulfatase, partial [Gloeobacteraceae cyanobacterium ES-bin-144]|nr:sulfatase [Verrucomicrobiales bacterium]